jgi:hypothetical protein
VMSQITLPISPPPVLPDRANHQAASFVLHARPDGVSTRADRRSGRRVRRLRLMELDIDAVVPGRLGPLA